MASDKPHDDRRDALTRSPRSDDEHPFVLFRRFVDQQASSLFDSIFNLPSALSRGSDKSWDSWEPWDKKRRAGGGGNPAGAGDDGNDDDDDDLFTKLLKDWDKNVEEEWKRFTEATGDEEKEGKPKEYYRETVDEDGTKRKEWRRSWSWRWPPKDSKEGEGDDECHKAWRRKPWWAAKDSEEGRETKEGEDDRTCDKGPWVMKPWRKSRTEKAVQENTNEKESIDQEVDRFITDFFSSPWGPLMGHRSGPFWGPWGPHPHHLSPMVGAMFGPFFIFGPYSPFVLEHDPRYNSIPWRSAFRDLVLAEHGRPMDSPKTLPPPHSHWWTPEEWRDQFFRREAGDSDRAEPSSAAEDRNADSQTEPDGNQERYFNDGDVHRAYPDFESGSDNENAVTKPTSNSPATEADMYERFLGDSSHQPPSSGQPFSSTQQSTRPSVLSTLTTTERTVAPDGTVVTKVVLKKRFADGREESSETVHRDHVQALDRSGDGALREMRDAQSQTDGRGEGSNGKGKGSGGWFWSG